MYSLLVSFPRIYDHHTCVCVVNHLVSVWTLSLWFITSDTDCTVNSDLLWVTALLRKWKEALSVFQRWKTNWCYQKLFDVGLKSILYPSVLQGSELDVSGKRGRAAKTPQNVGVKDWEREKKKATTPFSSVAEKTFSQKLNFSFFFSDVGGWESGSHLELKAEGAPPLAPPTWMWFLLSIDFVLCYCHTSPCVQAKYMKTRAGSFLFEQGHEVILDRANSPPRHFIFTFADSKSCMLKHLLSPSFYVLLLFEVFTVTFYRWATGYVHLRRLWERAQLCKVNEGARPHLEIEILCNRGQFELSDSWTTVMPWGGRLQQQGRREQERH